VLVWTAARRYVAVNSRAAELLGTTREALLDRPVGSTNRSGAAHDTIESVLHDAPARGATPFTRADGRETTLQWLVFPTTVAGLDHIVGVMWDADDIP
jgi:PAS domain-containing protein